MGFNPKSQAHHTTQGSDWIRRPSVAGYFYPLNADALRTQLNNHLADSATPAQFAAARAIVVPHGSYARCGAIIGAALGRVRIPRRCIILGPSHTDSWMSWSVMERGAYRTPLGDVPIDGDCAQALRVRCPFLEADAWAQHGEHAVEVLIPFLQRLGPDDLTIVPIIIAADDEAQFIRLGQALAQVARMTEEPVLLIASTDLSHYESLERTTAQDSRLLNSLLTLNCEALLREVRETVVRMCGYGAVVSVMTAAATLGADRAVLARYGTSVDAGGDPHSVIGYGSVIIP